VEPTTKRQPGTLATLAGKAGDAMKGHAAVIRWVVLPAIAVAAGFAVGLAIVRSAYGS